MKIIETEMKVWNITGKIERNMGIISIEVGTNTEFLIKFFEELYKEANMDMGAEMRKDLFKVKIIKNTDDPVNKLSNYQTE